MIRVEQVTKRFGDFTALEGIDFTVESGSVYGLVGYNGAGKTTILKTIAGIYRPDGGRVLVDGEDIYENEAKKQRLFFVPDELWFEPYATLQKTASFYKAYYPQFSDETFHKLTDVFGLDKKQRLSAYSKGMQRQAEIILALSARPAVLLMDESFDGLDPQKRNLMKNMLLEYAADRECAILISSHNLHEMGDMCDRVGLINGKRIVLDASVNELAGSRCKLRLVFSEEKTEADFAPFGCRRIEVDGKIVTLTLHGSARDAEEKLRALSPLLIESFPQSVEEIFLDEMEGTDYDFKDIFG